MKTATCLLFLGCLTNACLGQQDAAAARRAILEANAAQHRAQMAQARAEEARNMKEVVFSEESVSVSEPSDRLLFEHETNVDNFLSTAGKFGLGRILAIHLSNPRYATHGGVMKVPGFDKDGW
ncbi:MAG: hypothetical protein JNG86_11835, partial [Verrucomicrobiaceae bacterium]|nr:hypothetical protein [Verrucomicrobiaceae bacterium]